MRPDWRECPRDNVVGQWAALYVTMNPKGDIAMSRVTYQRLGEPKAFVILFDAVNNRIGLKPAALSMRNAYPVRSHGPRGGKKIRGFRLMQEFRIDLPETVRFYDADIDDDNILILDLRTARVSPKAQAYHRSKSQNREPYRPG